MDRFPRRSGLQVASGARPHIPVDRRVPLDAFGRIARGLPGHPHPGGGLTRIRVPFTRYGRLHRVVTSRAGAGPASAARLVRTWCAVHGSGRCGVDGSALGTDTLQKVSGLSVAPLEATGYVAWTASEPEFYLCDERWRRIYTDTRCWSMERGAELEPVLGEIRATLRGCNVPVESSQIEYGPGQMEIRGTA